MRHDARLLPYGVRQSLTSEARAGPYHAPFRELCTRAFAAMSPPQAVDGTYRNYSTRRSFLRVANVKRHRFRSTVGSFLRQLSVNGGVDAEFSMIAALTRLSRR